MTIIPALSLALTQSGNGASPNPAQLLPGVTGRSYGVIGGMPTYTASGGSGTYTFPASPGPYPAGFACVANATTYKCSANTLSAAGAAYPLSLSVSDSGNATTPPGSAPSTTSLPINSPIQLSQSLGTVWPEAVNGRAYGSGSNCTEGACAPAVYSATNGLGGYVWPSTIPASIAAITGMSCAVVPTTYSCSASVMTAAPTLARAVRFPTAPVLWFLTLPTRPRLPPRWPPTR